MKLDPHLPQLPSISELLEHPRVKGVVARINRSTIAQRAAGFLEELRASLAERSGKVEVPSVTQLAERLARRLLGEPPAGGPIINATGVAVGNPELTPPVADAALHAMMQVAGEYHDRGLHLRRAAESDLCHLTGAEAALAVSSVGAALHIVLGALAAGREIVVTEAANQPGGLVDWPRLAARHGAILHTSENHLESIETSLEAGKRTALFRVPDAASDVPTETLVAAARRRSVSFIDVCPMAGLLDTAAYGLPSIETLGQRIASGVDLVITDGAGLLGGPSCGVILGGRALVEAVGNHYLALLATVAPATAAALQATLAVYRHPEKGEAAFSIPICQLLSAPLDNLKQRAERLSALIAATGKVAAAEPQETERTWLNSGGLRMAAKTWGIAIRPIGSAAALRSHLERWEYPIATAAEGDSVHLDLRSVFPRWDQQLVAAIEGLTG